MSKDINKDALAEIVSSVIDGTATTNDIDRLLAADSKDWQTSAQSYAYTSSLLSGDKHAEKFTDLNILANIHSAIEQDDKKSTTPDNVIQFDVKSNSVSYQQPKLKRSNKPFANFAIAASVAFVVISGGSYLLDSNSFNAQQPAQASITTVPPVDIRPLQQVNVVIENKRLQTYLRQHAEQSTMATGQGILPMSRVVNYSIGQD
ncbi:hypothetical protein CBF23_013810 [Marinomonas agarivorans]|nr:hypothetical protein CBF23_013810 [Marinomonas agarivorans]